MNSKNKKMIEIIELIIEPIKKILLGRQQIFQNFEKNCVNIKNTSLMPFSKEITEICRDINILLRKIQIIEDLISNNCNIKTIIKKIEDENGIDFLWGNIEKKIEDFSQEFKNYQ